MANSRNLTLLSALLMIAMIVIPVASEINKNGFEMKYVDNNPTHTVSTEDVTGSVTIHIKAGGSAEDLLVFISRDDANNTPFDSTYRPDRSEIVGQNEDYLKVKVLADGVSKPERLTPGKYTAWLRNGNAGQMEKQSFIIGAKSTEQVVFLGHAVSSMGTPAKTLKIISALYGKGQTCTPTWVEEVNHTEYRYWIAGSDPVEAWTEHFGDYNQITVPATYKEVVDVPEHDEYRTYDRYHVTDHKMVWENFHLVVKVKCNNPAHSGWHTESPGCTDKYNFGNWVDHRPHSGSYETRHVDATYKTVVDVPEHFEYVPVGAGNGDWLQDGTYIAPVDHPAIPAGEGRWSDWSLTMDGGEVKYETRIVVDTPAHAGEPICDGGNYIDVTTIVQGLVVNGELHIEADYPNQHYNALFGDPCYGIFKELIVKYQINGATEETKTVAEDVDMVIT